MGSGRPSASAWRGGAGPGRAVGLRALVPGLPQWGWRQPERALVLFGAFASALAMGLTAWGTWAGWLLLAFAFGAHVTSTVDVIRQAAFPGFGRLVPWASASFGLGLGCYAPALAVASVLAWPATRPGDGYLVNRWAYRHGEPAAGEWAWVRPDGGAEALVARVVATAGRAVTWADDRLRVDGQAVPGGRELTGWRPGELSFDVPEGFVLVAVEPAAPWPPSAGARCGLQLVPRRLVFGRAWARLYPIWARRLLP